MFASSCIWFHLLSHSLAFAYQELCCVNRYVASVMQIIFWTPCNIIRSQNFLLSNSCLIDDMVSLISISFLDATQKIMQSWPRLINIISRISKYVDFNSNADLTVPYKSLEYLACWQWWKAWLELVWMQMWMDGMFFPMEVHQTFCCLVGSWVSQYVDLEEVLWVWQVQVWSGTFQPVAIPYL